MLLPIIYPRKRGIQPDRRAFQHSQPPQPSSSNQPTGKRASERKRGREWDWARVIYCQDPPSHQSKRYLSLGEPFHSTNCGWFVDWSTAEAFTTKYISSIYGIGVVLFTPQFAAPCWGFCCWWPTSDPQFVMTSSWCCRTRTEEAAAAESLSLYSSRKFLKLLWTYTPFLLWSFIIHRHPVNAT